MFEDVWIYKYRPNILDDIVLSNNNRKFFSEIKNTIPNLLFSGPPGIGKTSLGKIIVNKLLDCQYLYINASRENSIEIVRNKITNFIQTKSIDNKIKVIFLDEVDGFSNSAQDALRNEMEEYLSSCRFILTCNNINKVKDAIKSRCQHFDLIPPFNMCINKIVSILKEEKIKISNDQKPKLIKLIKNFYPDLRIIINELQKFTINNVLDIKEDEFDNSFIYDIFDKIKNNSDEFKLRKIMIDNEIKFNNDYQIFLKKLFEYVYNSDFEVEKKREMAIIIGKYLYRHQSVIDKEINAFCCLLDIVKIIKKM